MTEFYRTDTWKIVQAMKATGNQLGIIRRWKQSVEAWAAGATGPDADAARAWLQLWQDRPFYTAAELAPMWRVLPIALRISDRLGETKVANRLANELSFAQVPWRMIRGKQYFAVERLHEWRHASGDEWEWELFNAQP